MTSKIDAFKKEMMKHLWRVQQSAGIINTIIWAATLTGVFYKDYVKWRFYNFAIMIGQENNTLFFNDTMGTILLFFVIFAGILLIGFIYDKSKIWKEQNIVSVERNPYTVSYKLSAKEVALVKHVYGPTLYAAAKNEADAERYLFIEKWIERVLEEDPALKNDVLKIEKAIMSQKLKNESEIKADILKKRDYNKVET